MAAASSAGAPAASMTTSSAPAPRGSRRSWSGARSARPAPGQPLAAGLLFGHRLDLNRAALDDLVALPGIGAVRARRILEARASHGGRFHEVDDLARVPGVGDKTLALLRPFVNIDGI